jgi:predicted nucleotidyltransferase component of viral defense system
MEADRPHIEQAIEELARRFGHRVQRSADAFAGRKLYLTYRSVLGSDDRIEVDLNFLFRAPIEGTESSSMWQPGELDRPRVQVVSAVELCVGKLLALLDRASPRDAWDVARLPELVEEALADPGDLPDTRRSSGSS